MAFSGLPCCVLSFTLLLLPFSSAGASAEFQKAPVSGRRQLEEDGFGAWRRFVAELPSAGDATVQNGTFVLAAERTYRQDPMNGYQRYTGGWNIRNQHYWASVAFTAIPLFAIAVAWFLGCGLVLLLICCCYCCCGQRKHSYSRAADVISLVLLVLLTFAAIAGSVILYDGQGRFHKSTSATLDYVVGQANLTVENLQKFSGSLADARNIGVDQIFLPSDMQSKIDVLHTKINASATALSTQTSKNSKSIHGVLDAGMEYDHSVCSDAAVGIPRIRILYIWTAICCLYLSACCVDFSSRHIYLMWHFSSYPQCGRGRLRRHGRVGGSSARAHSSGRHPSLRRRRHRRRVDATKQASHLPVGEPGEPGHRQHLQRRLPPGFGAALLQPVRPAGAASLQPILARHVQPDVSPRRGRLQQRVEGVERLRLPDCSRRRGRGVHHRGSDHSQHLLPDDGGDQREPRAVLLRALPGAAGRLHLRPRNLRGPRQQQLPRPEPLQQMDLRGSRHSVRRRHVLLHVLDGLRQGAAAPQVQQAGKRSREGAFGFLRPSLEFLG